MYTCDQCGRLLNEELIYYAPEQLDETRLGQSGLIHYVEEVRGDREIQVACGPVWRDE